MVITFNYEEAKRKTEISVHELLSKYRVPPPLVLKESESIEHLINALIRYGKECALISGKSGKLIGIVTLFDLLKLFVEHRKVTLILRHPKMKPESEKSPVTTIMSPNPIKVRIDWSLKKVLELMLRYGVSHVVAVDPKNGEPVAVISKRIILRELLGIDEIFKTPTDM